MEWKFLVNWSFMVEEAKQRRKKLKLTQQRLALLASVSTPTISRFENAEKDIQWSSVFNILNVLGLTDQRRLDFSDSDEAPQLSKQEVRFYGKNESGRKIPCSVSVEALQDYFGASSKDLLKTFKAHQKEFEQLARAKYLYSQSEGSEEVVIVASDF